MIGVIYKKVFFGFNSLWKKLKAWQEYSPFKSFYKFQELFKKLFKKFIAIFVINRIMMASIFKFYPPSRWFKSFFTNTFFTPAIFANSSFSGFYPTSNFYTISNFSPNISYISSSTSIFFSPSSTSNPSPTASILSKGSSKTPSFKHVRKKEESAHVITIGSRKGGVGKSTLATNLAVWLALNKADVMIVDTDPQHTALNWLDRRSELSHVPSVFGVGKEGKLKATLEDFKTKYDVVIVDVAGRDSLALRSSLLVSHTLIVPTRPSQADLETIPYILEIAEDASQLNDKLKSYLLLSLASSNPMVGESEDARSLLVQKFPFIQLLPTIIRERKVYRDALLEGLGVCEFTKFQKEPSVVKAKQEIETLARSLFS